MYTIPSVAIILFPFVRLFPLQVLSPGDVAFTLDSGNDTTVILNSSDWDSDSICMSMTSLVGGLVMLLGKIIGEEREK